MREYVSTLIGTGEHTIRYRFQCEQCGKDSGWREKTFSKEVQMHADTATEIVKDKNTGRLTDEGLADTEKQFAQWHDSAIDDVLTAAFRNIQKGQYEELGLKSKCPHCGKLQTWAATRTYWGLFKGFLITLAALSVIMLGLVWIFAQYHLEWAFYIAAFISVICYAPPVISLSIKKMRTRHATDRQKPVINWNGWTPPTA